MPIRANGGKILVYRFLPANYAVMAIESGELRVGRISELNDPFEFNPVPIGGLFRGMPVAEYQRQLMEVLNQEVGVLCFSDSPHDPVVWSHYSQSHHGIALGFEFNLDDKLFKVDYPDDGIRPIFDPQKHEDDIAAQRPVSLRILYGIKAQSWHYEREYRKLIDLPNCRPRAGMYFYPFSLSELKEVVLGSRCRITSQYVTSALKILGISANVKKAELHFSKFEVSF